MCRHRSPLKNRFRIAHSLPLLTRVGLIALTLASLTTSATAAPGDLDPTFGNGGKVVTLIGEGDAFGRVALQADGKIVMAGTASVGGVHKFAVARYSNNGSLDPTFDGDGIVTTGFNYDFGEGYAVAIQPDGKIIVVGNTAVPNGAFGDYDFAVARYHTDGSLDTSFSDDGWLVTDFNNYDYALDVALQQLYLGDEGGHVADMLGQVVDVDAGTPVVGVG